MRMYRSMEINNKMRELEWKRDDIKRACNWKSTKYQWVSWLGWVSFKDDWLTSQIDLGKKKQPFANDIKQTGVTKMPIARSVTESEVISVFGNFRRWHEYFLLCKIIIVPTLKTMMSSVITKITNSWTVNCNVLFSLPNEPRCSQLKLVNSDIFWCISQRWVDKMQVLGQTCPVDLMMLFLVLANKIAKDFWKELYGKGQQ